MSIYALKPKFQNALRPVVRALHGMGVTANQVTLVACGVSLALGLLLAVYAQTPWLFCLLPVWMFVRMAMNAMDGMLAREFGQQSRFGGYLNELTDMVADAALYLPFAYVLPHGALAIGVVIFASAVSETAGILGQVHGNGRRYDGPSGKSDRAFVFGALGLLYAVTGGLALWATWLVWGIAVLLVVTMWRRVSQGLK